MIERYLVLDSDPADDGLRWNLDRSVQALLPDVGLTYRWREGDDTMATDLWEGEGTQVILSLIADHHTPSHYVMVEATSDELADRVTKELATVLPVLSLEELQKRAERGDDASALVRLAQGADPFEPDDRTAELIAAGFTHQEAVWRYRAAEAAGLAPRPDFLTPLEELAANDPDENVRAMAAGAAAECRPQSA